MNKIFALIMLLVALGFSQVAQADGNFTLKVEAPAFGQPDVAFSVTATLCDLGGHPLGTGTDLTYVSIDRIGAQALHMVNGVVCFNNLKSKFTNGVCTVIVTDPTHNLNKTVFIHQGV